MSRDPYGLTDSSLLGYDWSETPKREFKSDAPRHGRISFSRRPHDAPPVVDSRGRPGHTLIVVNEITKDGEPKSYLLPTAIVYHSPCGFEWGYAGSGPADLAANILALFVDLKEAWRHHQDFKFDHVCGLDRDRDELDLGDVRLWIEQRWQLERQNRALIQEEEETRVAGAKLKQLDAEEAELEAET